MEAFYRHREFIDGVRVPHADRPAQADQMLSGGMVKRLYFLARPGMGKTALALAIADYNGPDGRAGGLFSMRCLPIS